jgi:hypothetical protein
MDAVNAFVHCDLDEVVYMKLPLRKALLELQNEYQMHSPGELKGFLGIHVLRDRRQQKLWLSPEVYIE